MFLSILAIFYHLQKISNFFEKKKLSKLKLFLISIFKGHMVRRNDSGGLALIREIQGR